MLDTLGSNIPEYVKISSPKTLSIKSYYNKIYMIYCKDFVIMDYCSFVGRNRLQNYQKGQSPSYLGMVMVGVEALTITEMMASI